MTRWARAWDWCRGCGGTDKPHAGKGLCSRCTAQLPERKEKNRQYWRKRSEDPREVAANRARLKRWQMENHERVVAKITAWKKAHPEKNTEYTRNYRRKRNVLVIGTTGLKGSRIGHHYKLDGETVWDMILESGKIMEAVPAAILGEKA